MLQSKLDVIMATTILFSISNIPSIIKLAVFTKTTNEMNGIRHLAFRKDEVCEQCMLALKIDTKVIQMKGIMRQWQTYI